MVKDESILVFNKGNRNPEFNRRARLVGSEYFQRNGS